MSNDPHDDIDLGDDITSSVRVNPHAGLVVSLRLSAQESVVIRLSAADAEAVLRAMQTPPAPGSWLRAAAARYQAALADDAGNAPE